MNLTNYYDHPYDNRYIVYQFHMEEHADHFQSLLAERKVRYERHLETEEEGGRILFGVSKTFREEAQMSNYLTHAKYRNPFIANRALKYSLLFVTLAAIILALWGYFTSKG